MTATIGSLFSGIGGLELGLERAGLGPVIWQAESDPYATKILERHWPNAARFADVRDVRIGRGIERPDIICGGFPCQDLSLAGKRAGISGPKSGLWSEFHRAIREFRPRVAVVENVPTLVSGGLDIVLGGLAELGYDAEWKIISARDVGACHLRRRVFIIAYAPDAVSNGAQRCAAEPLPRFAELSWQQDGRGLARFGGVPGDSVPTLRRAGDGVPDRVDRLRCLGNAVVPQVAEVVGRRVMQIMGRVKVPRMTIEN